MRAPAGWPATGVDAAGRATSGDAGPWVLVLDVGSSSVRAWLFDRAGRGVDPGPRTQREYEWRSAPVGAMECDAPRLLELTAAALDATLEHARAAGLEIAAVAVTSFWHSLLGLGRDGAPVTPLYGWGDVRAAGDALRLRERLDERAIHRRTGCFLHPSYPSVKLLWLRREDPARFARTAAWVSFAEYLEQELFGTRRCSLSMASGTGLLDVHALQWDAEWLERAGVGPAQLSPLVDVDAPLHGLLPRFAARWPELAAVPWFPALGDGACANVGSGAVGLGTLALTVGTSAAARVLWPAERAEVPEGLWCYRLDRRHWVAGGALSNGGNAVAYLRRTLALPSEREWEATLAALEPDGHGLTILPFLVGERGPGWLQELRASVVGLTQATAPEHLLRAWMEAVAYRLAGVCERIEAALGPLRDVRASGGALHASPVWAQIIADVLGHPLVLPLEREASSRGAALVAQRELGWRDGVGGAPTEEAARFPARSQHTGRYRAARRRQEALERALRPWMETYVLPFPGVGEGVPDS
jgi:gluconokinase